MSLKLLRVVITMLMTALMLSMLPTVTYAGGRTHFRSHRSGHFRGGRTHFRSHRFGRFHGGRTHFRSHRFGRFHGGFAHRHGSSVRLWIGPIFGGWGWAPPVWYGESRVWVVPAEPVQPRQSVVPDQTTQEQYCREFQRDIIIDGKPERAYGTACQQPDGSWKIVP